MSARRLPRALKNATKKPAKPSIHPPVAAMVTTALVALKDRNGSSLQAIKKYIPTNNKGIDMDRIAPFIRRFLKKAVAENNMVQTKGTYKMKAKPKTKKLMKARMPATKKATKPRKVKTPKKTATKTSPKKYAAKKPVAKKTSK